MMSLPKKKVIVPSLFFWMTILFGMGSFITSVDGARALRSQSSEGQSSQTNGSGARWFAYMTTSTVSYDDLGRQHGEVERNRTHVFALTTKGTLADRFVKLVEGLRSTASKLSVGNEQEEPCRYQKLMQFPSIHLRYDLVNTLHDNIMEYNRLIKSIFEQNGENASPEFIITMKERFGREQSETTNQKYPSSRELKSFKRNLDIVFKPEVEKLIVNAPLSSDTVDVPVYGGKVDRDDLSAAYHALTEIKAAIEKLGSLNPWKIENRFSFNVLVPRGGEGSFDCFDWAMFKDEDYEMEDSWKLTKEIGGLYLARSHPGKTLLNIMWDKDVGALKDKETRSKAIGFSDSYDPTLVVTWTLGNATEYETEQEFRTWWDRYGITKRYGYQYGNKREPNGFLRIGQQVCYPASDCDRTWEELLDEFAETPWSLNIKFSQERPYGETDEDLRFLYPGDDFILEWKREQERAKQKASHDGEL